MRIQSATAAVPIRLLVVDDHRAVRDGLVTIFGATPGLTVVGEGADGHEAVERFRELRPDVTLMDLAMPKLDGAGAISAIRAEFPDARILGLTAYGDAESMGAARDAGARAVLSKSMPIEAIVAEIRAACPPVGGSGGLPAELAAALERDELSIDYQPVVSLADGSVRGFEALVRWVHPERGIMMPAQFLPGVEEAGLIVDLGERVLTLACRQAAGWEGAPHGGLPPTVSVNVAGSQLVDPRLPAHIAAALATAGLSPHRLEIEVTERAFVEGGPAVKRAIDELRELGVRTSVDDFGTGSLSMAWLHRYALDTVKLDPSLVSVTGRHADALRAIVSRARGLGLAVVAKGIETPQQLALVRTVSCDWGQGRFFARPLPAAASTELLGRVHQPWSSHFVKGRAAALPSGA